MSISIDPETGLQITGCSGGSGGSGGGGGGGSTVFYECASYTPDAEAYTRYSFALSGAPNEDINGTYERTKWVESPEDTGDYVTTAEWKSANGCKIIEKYGYGEWSYSIKDSSGTTIYGTDMPLSERASDYSTIPWMDMDMYESVTLTFGAVTAEEIPATTEGWTGYEMVWQEASGDTPAGYVKSETLTEGLEVKGYTPRVVNIYNADTTIEVKRAFDGSTLPITQDGLVFYAPLQNDYIDVVSKSNAVTTGGEFGEYNGKKALRFDGTKQWVYYGSDCNYPDSNIWSMGVVYAPLTSMSGWWMLTRILGDSWWYINGVGSSLLPENSAGSIVNQKWQSCFITYNNGVHSAYVDGLLTKTYEKSTTNGLASGLVINAGAADGGSIERYLDGYISDVAVYDRELSAAEVLEIHKALMEGVRQ